MLNESQTVFITYMAYSTGLTTPGLRANLTSERNVTTEDVVAEADRIWAELKRRKIPEADMDASLQFLEQMQAAHPQFATSYAIMLRYICQFHTYDSGVFARWLKRIQTSPWKSEDEYIEYQSDYVMMLFRHFNPKAPNNHRWQVRNNIRELLKHEYAEFKATGERCNKIVTARDEQLKQKNMSGLIDYAKQSADEIEERSGTIRVEIDDALAAPPVGVIKSSITAARAVLSAVECGITPLGLSADELLL